MIGPFTTAPGGFTHTLVAIDKFTKWIEYKPITKLTPDRVVDFISDILHRFDFPNTIITNLGSNFTANQFWEFCENTCIEVKYVSVALLRANGQVERTNGMIIEGLKKRLYDENSKKGGKVDTRVATCHLGAQNSAVQSHRTNTIFSCLRLRSNFTS
jgi:hypothetical protein